jgi:CubicO group peptidase (beta-lactamase class C family)
MFNGVSGQTLDQKIQVMLNSSQVEPGTKFTYYNMGYGTLGKIVEVVSGKEFSAYLKELYATAGVVDFGNASQSAATRRPNEATYYPQGSSTAYGSDVNVIKAAGGLAINTVDLFKVLYAVDGQNKQPDILNAATRTLMFTPSTVFSGYAKGWRTNHSLFTGYYHGGNVIGTATFWIYGGEYSVAVLLNSRSNESGFDTELIVLTNNIMNKAKDLNL